MKNELEGKYKVTATSEIYNIKKGLATLANAKRSGNAVLADTCCITNKQSKEDNKEQQQQRRISKR